MPPIEPILIDRLEYRGFGGCACWCELELRSGGDGRTVVIATEVEDNPGTSITNVAEHLASYVCDRFAIDPNQLVWIEHYEHGTRAEGTYDLVFFCRRAHEAVAWSPAVLRAHPSGWPGYFDDPQWRPMTDEHWRRAGLEPRRPDGHPSRRAPS